MDHKIKSQKVRLKDVAAEAGVSSCTASRALNGTMLNKVSEETRQRILNVAESMGYKPNIMARGLARKRTNLLGVLLPEIRTSFLPQTLEGIWHAAEDAGMAVLLHSTDWQASKEGKYLYQLLEWQVDAIIWVPSGPENIKAFSEVEKNTPVIQLFTDIKELASSKIVLDNEKGGYIATKHLIEKGHTRIAHLSATTDHFTPAGKDRLRGYLRALQEANLPIDEKLIVESSYTAEGGRKAFREVVKYQPTAIFACSDMTAWGVIQQASLLGIRVPEDLAVVGFDNIHLSSLILPALTTVEQPQEKFGEIAVKQVIAALDNKPSEKITLEPRLIERKSS